MVQHPHGRRGVGGKVGAGLTVLLMGGTTLAGTASSAAAATTIQPITSFCASAPTSKAAFTDVAGTFFSDAIRCLSEAGITSGGPAGLPADQYGPGLTVNRASMASFVARTLDRADSLESGGRITALPAADPASTPFRDTAGNVHADAISRLARAGIVLGGAGGAAGDVYRPDDPVTRAQMATFLARSVAFMTGSPLVSTTDFFTDDDGSVHEADINAIAAAGITGGRDATRYAPSDVVRRDAMAAFLLRSLAGLADRGLINPTLVRSVIDCDALTGMTVAPVDGRDVAIVAAEKVGTPDSPVAACAVQGTITVKVAASTSTIRFETRLPADSWNGQYVQLGGGGFCGSVPTSAGAGADALARGFAIASDDTGHQGSSGDGTFAYDNPAAELAWGQLSEHLTLKASQAVLEEAYGTTARRTFFVGCSTGGRQALVLAQQFPNDFDGIVAGAPAIYQNELATLSQGLRELQNRDAQDRVILDQAASAVVKQQVLTQCDAIDGLVDGVVGDPRSCVPNLDVVRCAPAASTGCLTQAQIDVAKRWYDSPRLPSGAELYPGGLPVGSEGGWPGYNIGKGDALSGGGNYAQEVLRYLAFPEDPGPTYSLFDFDPAKDSSRLRTNDSLYNADSTNMAAFERAGGKLLMYHGLADPLITPQGTIQYYEDVVRFQGGSLPETQKWFRSYFLPGVYHCTGGPGPDSVDWLTAITDWVDRGQQPEQLVATKTDAAGAVTARRPLYPYPLRAQYDGTGSPDKLTSFSAVVGPRGR